MKYSIILLLSVILIAGISAPAYAQTISDHVVINEVDTNPSGDDSQSASEWVELYNPTDDDVDLSGWQIASTTVLKKTLTIPDGTIIDSGDFLTFVNEKVWFTDTAESIELKNTDGLVIDKTREIYDLDNDSKTWQRIYDGYSDWKFVSGTAGGSNGQLPLDEIFRYKALGDRWSELASIQLNLKILDQSGKIDIERLFAVHRSIFPDNFPWAGKYRNQHVYVVDNFGTTTRVVDAVHAESRTGTIAPDAIEDNLESLLQHWNTNISQTFQRESRFKIDEVANFHHEFELIHPFLDGNGRIGRMLLEEQLSFLFQQRRRRKRLSFSRLRSKSAPRQGNQLENSSK